MILGKIVAIAGLTLVGSGLLYKGIQESNPVDVVSIGDFNGDKKNEVIGVRSFVDTNGQNGERLVFYKASEIKWKNDRAYSSKNGKELEPAFMNSSSSNRYWQIVERSPDYTNGNKCIQVKFPLGMAYAEFKK